MPSDCAHPARFTDDGTCVECGSPLKTESLPDQTGPMRRRTARIILRSILEAAADGKRVSQCEKVAADLLDIVAERGLTDD